LIINNLAKNYPRSVTKNAKNYPRSVTKNAKSYPRFVQKYIFFITFAKFLFQHKTVMFQRIIEKELLRWKDSTRRKPLLLRGPRQVGKTTIVGLFARHYKQYLYLNLEREQDAQPFKQFGNNLPQLLEALFFTHGKDLAERDTLIFIDEIQAVPEAVSMLRYFYEDVPHLHIIAAGSLLETLLDRQITIPVGRVEYKVLRPCAFPEFLLAMGETAALQQLQQTPPKDYAHQKLLQLFHTYTLIGGMPEVINAYAEQRNLTALTPIYESLLLSYINDVEKYARNDSFVQIMRHVIRSMYATAGMRITFQGFGRSNYGSREVGEAMRAIEGAMLFRLMYPVTSVAVPIEPDLRKAPRLHVHDVGLMNHFAGLQKEIIGTTDIDTVYNGRVIEHVVGQELLAVKFNAMSKLDFWVREKKDSSAEVDYVLINNGLVIPIEVKSGATGTLRSLHLFMDAAPHDIAVRFYKGKYRIDDVKTLTGKPFRLLNLPYYLASQAERYIEQL
jgi:predicted AAA+ superfamily ATPase